jgi:hypothetical protein
VIVDNARCSGGYEFKMFDGMLRRNREDHMQRRRSLGNVVVARGRAVTACSRLFEANWKTPMLLYMACEPIWILQRVGIFAGRNPVTIGSGGIWVDDRRPKFLEYEIAVNHQDPVIQ